MSFSLSVYLREYTEEIDQAWMAKFSKLGLQCEFPPGYSLLTTYDIVEPVILTVGPPLISEPWKPTEVGLAVSQEDVDPLVLEHAREHPDPDVRRVMAQASCEFLFYSTAGRSDPILLMQVYGAAALADVAAGVLVNEDLEMQYGAAAYKIAQKNSDHMFRPRPPVPPGLPQSRSWWRNLAGWIKCSSKA